MNLPGLDELPELREEPEFNEEQGNYREKEIMFCRTTKLKGINMIGRDSALQFKKRIGGEGTKVPHHRRIMTDSKGLPQFVERRLSPTKSPQRFGLERRRNSDEKVRIIETLENPDGLEECKSDIIAFNVDKMSEKIDRQIKQAEELVAKVTQDRIDIDDLDLEESGKNSLLEQDAQNSDNIEDEKEMEVTVGEVLKDIAVLVTSEYYLFAWPLDMLPKNIKKGIKLSILIKRNNNSEVLRKNSIYTQQNDILKLILKE